jgi:hypothetical protein
MSENKQKRIENAYEKAFSQLGTIQVAFPLEAKREMSKMVEQIARTDKILAEKIINTQQNINIKGGFAAEEALAESYNLDAILKGKESRALTSRYDEWGKTGLKGNDPVADIVGVNKDVFSRNEANADVIYKAQSKFWDTPESTAGGLAQVKDGRSKYQGTDAAIGPKDQINPTDGSVISVADHALAKAQASEAKGDMAQAEASMDVAIKATDKVEFNDASGKGFTKEEANQVGAGLEAGEAIKKDYRDDYQTASTLNNMKQAAVNAAAISAVASGVFNTFTYVKMAAEGKISEKEAVIKICSETLSSAADSAFKCAANSGIQSCLVRYAGDEVAKGVVSGLAANSTSMLLRTNILTVGVICGVDLVKDMVRLGMGKIDGKEFETKSVKNVLSTAFGVTGASVGANAAGAMGIAYAGLIGGLAGGLIAGLAVQFAISNHIERPYKQLLYNTVVLAESMKVFEQVSRDIYKGQAAFSAYLEAETLLDRQMEQQLKISADSTTAMKKAIDKL